MDRRDLIRHVVRLIDRQLYIILYCNVVKLLQTYTYFQRLETVVNFHLFISKSRREHF